MSVAFRRENDDEHLEPRFELPLPAGPNLVTPRGHALIAARVAELEQAPEAEDSDARDTRTRALRYWRTRLATAQRAPRPEGDAVAIGTQVRFRLQGRERTLIVTGHDEADGDATRIGFSAPLARALLGGMAGDRAGFGGRDEAIEIMDVAIAETEWREPQTG
ncbi:GreA/GreB family elongation factor [Sphingomonas morindae]|uniref:GreA/GreB family elongation factor n=1 Tax=Sphingomonas morindae TaxID=1541170 RepID=A0ABY4XAW4_9SPHN|nr:GreA/GreB family elongation factor [Sphingomonas morindae]USI74039.1 GreA/GreB family elongation factor [Sphingomonas morindae]